MIVSTMILNFGEHLVPKYHFFQLARLPIFHAKYCEVQMLGLSFGTSTGGNESCMQGKNFSNFNVILV